MNDGLAVAVELLGTGRAQDALRAVETVLCARPTLVAGLLLAARCHEALGDLDAATSRLEQVVGLDPGQVLATERLGALALARGRIAVAEAAFERARTLSPFWAPPFRGLACCALADGRLEDARALLLRARALDPEDRHVVAELARLDD